jgi:hypothetical protein
VVGHAALLARRLFQNHLIALTSSDGNRAVESTACAK